MISHFVIVYKVLLQHDWSISHFTVALEKTLKMRQEWQSRNCINVDDAKKKNVYFPTMEELETAISVLNAGATFNNNDIKQATKLLRSIILYNSGI